MYIGSPDNNEGVIGFGADFAQSGGAVTSYTAKDTSAGVMRVDNGALYYYADTGLTAGNSFTPTQRFLVEANGNTTIGGTLSVAG